MRLPHLKEAGLLVVILLLGFLLTVVGGDVTLRVPPAPGEAPRAFGDERTVTVNNFFRPDNIVSNVFTPMSWMAIMAIGVTCVIIAGGIDISVGSIYGLAALGAAAAVQALPEEASAWQILPTAFVVPMVIGLVCGCLNGALVVGLRMHPFIVTLSTMSIFRGISLISISTGSITISSDAFTSDFMQWTLKYTRSNGLLVLLEPMPLIIMLIVVALGWIYLSWSVWGRENYAIGGNEEAARFSGLRVGWIKFRVYAISGLCAGIAAVVSVGKYGSAATNTGETYELMVIAAAVVGGASLTGGRGTAIGAVLGALVIQLIENGLSIVSSKKFDLGFMTLSISKEYTKIIVGTAIILAVAVDRMSQGIQSRRLMGAKK